jgi:hypothetical protein
MIAPLVDRADRCCIYCGLIGGLLTVIAIETCQNWQAIASIFS